jgi:hypothetical protein
LHLTADDPIAHVVGFGSASGRLGGVGQTDYAMANEMLAKLLDWVRAARPECRAVTFHWHSWDEVGMAVRPESRHAAPLRGMRYMPPCEGATHLIDELRAGVPEREVLITDPQFCTAYYPDTHLRSPAAPLIERMATDPAETSSTATIVFDPAADPFLLEHRYKDRPMLPAVIVLEAFAARAAAGAGKKIAELRDVEIVNSLRFFTDALQTAHVRLTPAAGAYQCALTCDFRNRAGRLVEKDRLVATGSVLLADATEAIVGAAPPAEPSSWVDIEYDDRLVIYHGPVFRRLRQSRPQPTGGWGRIVAPPPGDIAGSRSAHGWAIDAAVVDSCLFNCGIHLWAFHDRVISIPSAFRTIRLGRRPDEGETCTMRMHFRGRDENAATYDMTLYGAAGDVLVDVAGYRCIVVGGAAR